MPHKLVRKIIAQLVVLILYHDPIYTLLGLFTGAATSYHISSVDVYRSV